MRSYLLKSLSVLLLAMTFVVLSAGSGKACDRAEVRLDSLIIGTNVEIQLTVFIGGGITGASTGAGGATRTFGFAFYGNATLTVLNYPASLSSDSTMTTYNATVAPGAFGSTVTVAYIYNGIDFSCITTTAACGNRHTDSITVRFTMSEVPDSLRLLGIEGAGNARAGCFPDADMLIEFATPLPVEWADFDARIAPLGVELKWATASEKNSDHFVIQRSADGEEFETLSELDAVGNSPTPSNYRFIDRSPIDGTNYYRIVQVDADGAESSSEIRQIAYQLPAGMQWTDIGPNPVRDQVSMSFYTEFNETVKVRIIDLQGQVILQQQVQASIGNNLLEINTDALATGYYNLQIQGTNGMLKRKMIKM